MRVTMIGQHFDVALRLVKTSAEITEGLQTWLLAPISRGARIVLAAAAAMSRCVT